MSGMAPFAEVFANFTSDAWLLVAPGDSKMADILIKACFDAVPPASKYLDPETQIVERIVAATQKRLVEHEQLTPDAAQLQRAVQEGVHEALPLLIEGWFA